MRYANDPEVCDVYWASHGCSLPRGHEGDKLSHRCEPCPPDCPDAYTEESWVEGWMNDYQHCPVHCNSRPDREYVANQYGGDVDLYPEPALGVPS
jgi:hypothetical protein